MLRSPRSTTMSDPVRQAWSGIDDCRRGDWEKGFEALRLIPSSDPAWNALPSLYYSYLGFCLAAYEDKHKTGHELCQMGIGRGSFEADNYLNLARIYWLGDRLDLASGALDSGLEFDPENARMLRLRTALGKRQPVSLSFLRRSHRLNITLGRLRRNLQRRWRPAPRLSSRGMASCWLD